MYRLLISWRPMYLEMKFYTDISCHKTGTSHIPCPSVFLRLCPLSHNTSFKIQEELQLSRGAPQRPIFKSQNKSTMKLSIEFQKRNRQNGERLRNVGMNFASEGTTETQKPPLPLPWSLESSATECCWLYGARVRDEFIVKFGSTLNQRPTTCQSLKWIGCGLDGGGIAVRFPAGIRGSYSIGTRNPFPGEGGGGVAEDWSWHLTSIWCRIQLWSEGKGITGINLT